jgi:hypothetical protein
MTKEEILEVILVLQAVVESNPTLLNSITKVRFNAFLNLAKASLQIT